MPATKRQVNWTAVSFTPSGGSPIPITGVTDVQVEGGGSLLKFSGDADRYNTTIVHDFSEPMVTITTADLVALNALPIGTVGSFTATHLDAKNLNGAGAITHAVALAIVEDNTGGGAHRKFGEGKLKLNCVSPDGSTHPIVSTVAGP